MEPIKNSRKMQLNQVEIQKSGEKIRITLVTVGANEGLVVGQAAELFNVTESTIYKHLQKHEIAHKKIVTGRLQLLKNSGIVNSKAIHAIFIPRYGLRELLRVIDTDEAKAAYHQLFDDSEELMKSKPEIAILKQRLDEQNAMILKISGQLKAALDRSAIDQAKIRASENVIAELQAKIDAATHHISLGRNKKVPEFSVPIYRREPNDIFDNPVYSIEVVKKPISQMSKAERGKFRLYHCSKTIVGLSSKMVKDLAESHVTNHDITERAEQLCAIAKALNSDITPRSLLN